jgi:PAS domain S-box-containing protein
MPHRRKLVADENEAVIEAARSRDQGHEAVIATDSGGKILYWNGQASALYGWPADEVLGRNVLDVTPTRGSGDAATQIMEDMRRGEEWSGEFIVKQRDGTPMIVHVQNFAVRSRGIVIGVVGVSRPSARTPSS